MSELCTSCLKPIEPGQEWCKTPQCMTDVRDSNNRIPEHWVRPFTRLHDGSMNDE